MNPTLEILLSTQNRRDLTFLKKMFPGGTEGFDILIVNQISEDDDVPDFSAPSNIRIINSKEKGISKSRNLALSHAQGDVLMLADDDVIYEPGFHTKVLKYHQLYDNEVIIFPLKDEKGRLFGRFPFKDKNLKRFDYVYSPQISFKKSILKSGIFFDEQFGLGAQYPDSENYIWLTLLHRSGVRILYAGSVSPFMEHPSFTSSHIQHTDIKIRTRLAVIKKLYGIWVYPYYFKLIFGLWRRNLIPFSSFWKKWKCLG